jgi:hypothetical protein
MVRCTTSEVVKDMAKLSKERIGTLLKAKRREPVKTPFYYAPPFLEEVRRTLQERLTSSGGRPTVSGWDIVRKTRYSKKTWSQLSGLAARWSKTGGVSVSPSQVAARIVEEVCRSHGR